MPSEKQKTITIHKYIWNHVESIFNEKRDYWLIHNVRSPTGLAIYWLLEKIREHDGV